MLPHHCSHSRDIRFATENRLKTGDVRAVVATASLKLGIDIGSVDLVVQLDRHVRSVSPCSGSDVG